MDFMRLNYLIQPNIIIFKQEQLRIQFYYKNKAKYIQFLKSITPRESILNYDWLEMQYTSYNILLNMLREKHYWCKQRNG
jgi:hypothetical protein